MKEKIFDVTNESIDANDCSENIEFNEVDYFNELVRETSRLGTYNNFCDFDLFMTKDKIIKIEKNGFDLYIPTNCNTDKKGYFFVDSKNGHDCYAYDKGSVHSYYVLDGNGAFIINNVKIVVEKGSVIVIPPYATFYYEGCMKMIEKIEPNFKDENFVVVEEISYENKKNML